MILLLMRRFLAATAILVLAGTASAQDVTPPNRPMIDAVEVVGCRLLKIEWTNEVDPAYDYSAMRPIDSSGLQHYRLYWQIGKGEVRLAGSTTGGEPPFWSGIRRAVWTTAETGFRVGVSAVDRSGNESAIGWSDTVTMPLPTSVTCTDHGIPLPPSGITANIMAGTCTQAEVTWHSVVDWGVPVASGINRYNAYRDGELVRSVTPGLVLRAEDRFGLVPGQTYAYTVTAVDNAGNESAHSAPFHLTPHADCSRPEFLGDRPVVIYGVRFADAADATVTMTDLDAIFFGHPAKPDARSARSFFTETSYGRVTLQREFVGGWYVLPHDTDHYCFPPLTTDGRGANCNRGEIFEDTVAASSYKPSDSALVVFIVRGSSDLTRAGRFVRIHPDFGLLGTLSVAAHEMSHTFAVEHSSRWGKESSLRGCLGFDLLGPDSMDLQLGCKLFFGADGYSPLGIGKLTHHPAFTKTLMGFLQPHNSATVTRGTWTIGRLEDMQGATLKELRVPLQWARDHGLQKAPFYSVEYRTPRGYDGPLSYLSDPPFDGLLIRLVPHRFHAMDAHTFLVTKLELGSGRQTFQDAENGIGLRLVWADGVNAVVEVCGPSEDWACLRR